MALIPYLTSLNTLQAWAQWYIAVHPRPDFTIGPPENPQLQRWYIIPRNQFTNVYLHRFMRSDDNGSLHDHPWDSRSLIIQGGYIEETLWGSETYKQYLGESGFLHGRKASEAHRIILPTPDPVITLFFTGPVIREWGFHTARGWVPWKEYVEATPQGNQRRRTQDE